MKRFLIAIFFLVVFLAVGIAAYFENGSLEQRAEKRAALAALDPDLVPDQTIAAATAYLNAEASAPDGAATLWALGKYETALRHVIPRDLGNPDIDLEAVHLAYRSTRKDALARLERSPLIGVLLQEDPLDDAAEPAPPPFRGFTPLELVPIHLSIDRRIELGDDIHVQSNGEEHVRDLLLQAILGAYQGDDKTIAWALHDANIPRKSYLNTTSQPQYGVTRIALVDEGVGVLLVPHDTSDAQRHDWSAMAADTLAVASGDRIHTLYVFEYCSNDVLHPALADTFFFDEYNAFFDEHHADLFATLRLNGSISGERLYSSEFGFVETTIDSLAALENFLGSTDDLIGLSENGASVIARGRAYEAREYRRVTSEHVATLWQAIDDISRAQEDFNRQLDRFYSKWADNRLGSVLVDALVAEGIVRRGTTFGEVKVDPDLRLLVSRLRQEAIDALAKEIEILIGIYGSCEWHLLRFAVMESKSGRGGDNAVSDDEIALIGDFERLMDNRGLELESKLRGGVGFSLDTEYDYATLLAVFDNFIATGNPKIVADIEQFVPAIRSDLRNDQSGLLLCALDRYGREDYQSVRAELLDKASFQIARYDGGIQGTEVGQILFLTDLLAKLLDMNFKQVFNAYFPEYPGWKPTVYTSAPKIYQQQLYEFPGTRIWFNLQYGAALETLNGVRFAPSATRVFALAQDSSSGESELQPGYLSETYVNWFNNNYDIVAAQEPAYDQLNQIVKWSYGLDKLHSDFRMLRDVPIRRNFFFPDWALDTGVQNAESYTICFHEKGLWHASLETMPMFHVGWPSAQASWCDGQGDLLSESEIRVWAMRGGVSLPRRERFVELRADPSELRSLPPSGRRIATLKGTVDPDAGLIRYAETPTFNSKASYEVAWDPASKALTVNRSAEAVRLDRTTQKFVADDVAVYNRGTRFEIRDSNNEATIDLVGKDLGLIEADVTVGDMLVSTARTSVAPNSVHISVEHGPIGLSEGISKHLSRLSEAEWHIALLREPGVEASYSGQGAHYARLQGEWIEFRRTEAPELAVDKDFLARGSSAERALDHFLGLEVNPVTIRRVDLDTIARKLDSPFGLEIVRSPRDDGSFVIDIRGPPDSSYVGRFTKDAEPPDGAFRLAIFKDRDESGRTIILNAIEGKDTLSGHELNAAIDSVKGGVDVAADPILVLPRTPPSEIDLKAVYETRAAAFDGNYAARDTVARFNADRSSRLTAITEAYRTGDIPLATQLKKDMLADRFVLTRAETEALAGQRLEAAARAAPLEQRGVMTRAAEAIRSKATRAEAEAIGQDLYELWRTDPVRAEAVYREVRRNLGEAAQRGSGYGRFETTSAGVSYTQPCMLRKTDALSQDALSSIRPYVDVRAIAQDLVPTWPPTGTARLTTYRAEISAQQKDLIDLVRPDEFRIGQTRFVLLPNLRLPTLEEAATDPIANETLVTYFETLLKAAGAGEPLGINAPDGGDDTFIFVTAAEDEEDSQTSTCFAPLDRVARN